MSSNSSRITHYTPFISRGWLHLNYFQFELKFKWTQSCHNWDVPIPINQEFLDYLSWFCHQRVLQRFPLHSPELELLFFTDASLEVLGNSLEQPGHQRLLDHGNSRHSTSTNQKRRQFDCCWKVGHLGAAGKLSDCALTTALQWLTSG